MIPLPTSSRAFKRKGIPLAPTPTSYSPHEPTRSFAFGRFNLQPERQLLLRDDTRVRIGGRAIDILTALVQRPGDLMSKHELLLYGWPNLFVDESNLKVTVASLRRIFDETPGAPHFIATVPGRGYRFIASVQVSGAR
jgi:DNA-binding winged helix-turn-helix (wHTH) protein